jgi:hypothetical protein
MEHLLEGDEHTQKCSTYHIVYYLKKDVNPLLTAVNIDAKNVLEAVIEFLNEYPERVDDILYVTLKTF